MRALKIAVRNNLGFPYHSPAGTNNHRVPSQSLMARNDRKEGEQSWLSRLIYNTCTFIYHDIKADTSLHEDLLHLHLCYIMVTSRVVMGIELMI